MKTITSTQNDEIKHIVKLHNKSYRKQYQQFIAQGYSVFNTLLNQNYKLLKLYITETSYNKHKENIVAASPTIVSDHVMKKISTTSTPTDILAIFAIPKPSYELTSNAIVLHTIQDPGNMGTLIRTAAAMNIENVFVIDGADPYGPKTIQATAGTIAYVNSISIKWDTFLQQHQNFLTCALVVEKGQLLQTIDVSQSIIIVGNEGQGLPQNVIKQCKQHVTIEMPGNTESINAAIAGSIAMYQKSINS